MNVTQYNINNLIIIRIKRIIILKISLQRQQSQQQNKNKISIRFQQYQKNLLLFIINLHIFYLPLHKRIQQSIIIKHNNQLNIKKQLQSLEQAISKLYKNQMYRQQIDKQEQQNELNNQGSFLSRYFQSKEFTFPQFDQDLLNNQLLSLSKLALNYQQQTLDFKSWILNKYPLSPYFKKIILQQKNVTIINPQIINIKSINVRKTNQAKTIYIGQTNSGLKHGYGFQISLLNYQESEKQQKQSQQNRIQYQAYQGFFVNNIRHGLGRYYSNHINLNKPVYYHGRFINGQTYDNNYALIIWSNNDFYLGKVKPKFSKQGLGVLFISYKPNLLSNSTYKPNYRTIISSNYLTKSKVMIRKDSYLYQKVIVSDWQQNTTKAQSNDFQQKPQKSTNKQKSNKKSQSPNKSTNQYQTLLTQTKIISHNEFYFGQAYVYYSSKSKSHISLKQGNGFLKYINGDIYQGNFTYDKINGYGKYVWNNQNYYIGQFMDGQKHGSGYWKQYKTNDQYEGEYRNNKRYGRGQYRWSNGNIYNGEFKNDLRYGNGKMIWSTGQIYEGSWVDGLQHGIGKLYLLKDNTNQFIRESQFINGIQMQSPQNIQPLPQFLNKQIISRQSIKQSFKQSSKDSSNSSFKRNRNFSNLINTNKLKSEPNESDFRKLRNHSSQLPKINQKTALRFRTQEKPIKKIESTQSIIDKIKSKIPKLITPNEKKKYSPSRTLDYTQTQKLPYHTPVNRLHSKTQKIQKNKMHSYFSGSTNKQKKKKTYYIDVQLENDNNKSPSKRQRQRQKNSGLKNSQNSQINQYKKLNEILADSLMIPIKWRNIKRKSHNFILQRKEKRLDQSFN